MSEDLKYFLKAMAIVAVGLVAISWVAARAGLNPVAGPLPWMCRIEPSG